MKKGLNFTLLFLLFPLSLFAQIYDPITWSTEVKDLGGNQWQLIATAQIEEGWHLYSLKIPEGGPRPTVFEFPISDDYKLTGNMVEDQGAEVYDKIFDMDIKYFDNQADFKQVITRLNNKSLEIKIDVEFMVCDDERCLPPTSEELFFYLPEIKVDKEPNAEKFYNWLIKGINQF